MSVNEQEAVSRSEIKQQPLLCAMLQTVSFLVVRLLLVSMACYLRQIQQPIPKVDFRV